MKTDLLKNGVSVKQNGHSVDEVLAQAKGPTEKQTSAMDESSNYTEEERELISMRREYLANFRKDYPTIDVREAIERIIYLAQIANRRDMLRGWEIRYEYIEPMAESFATSKKFEESGGDWRRNFMQRHHHVLQLLDKVDEMQVALKEETEEESDNFIYELTDLLRILF